MVATCPGATRLLGTGFELTPDASRVFVRQIFPNVALTSNTVGADEASGGGAPAWGVTAYAICGTPPGAVAPVRLAQSFGLTPANQKTTPPTAPCPGYTTGVGGWAVSDPAGPPTAG